MSGEVCKPPGDLSTNPPERPAGGRVGDFEEAIGGYSRDGAREAAARCLASYRCSYCEVCELLCPDLCITRDPRTGGILIDLNFCKGCGLCAHFCPKGAIRMELESSE